MQQALDVVYFRVDASPQIGSGHLMRCMTLAIEIRRAFPKCKIGFVARYTMPPFDVQLVDLGFTLARLEAGKTNPQDGGETPLRHSQWLGNPQSDDATQTIAVLENDDVDLVVVDHYGIDAQWEARVSAHTRAMLVIDDLADRKHVCDYLLDQSHDRSAASLYDSLVGAECNLLVGSEYALLRPEFRLTRQHTAIRRCVENVLVIFGAVDTDRFTMDALASLGKGNFRNVAVVIGRSNPAIDDISRLADKLGFELHIQSEEVHRLMATADLAIGAAGATSWERCCVGLPSICLSVAENQNSILAGLVEKNAAVAITLEDRDSLADLIYDEVMMLSENSEHLAAMSEAAYNVVDGLGTERVMKVLGGMW